MVSTMPKPQRSLDPGDPVDRFARDLRKLRFRAGDPSLSALAHSMACSHSTVSAYLNGRRLPPPEQLASFVRACKGDTANWLERLEEVREQRPVRTARATRSQEGLPSAAQVTAAADGMEVLELSSRTDFWRYAGERIRTSQTLIDDLTWGLSPSAPMTADAITEYARYRRNIGAASTGKGKNRNKIYRELMSFPDSIRIPHAAALMDERYPNYHLRFYDFNHAGTPLLLQFYIFDRSEVLISTTPLTGSDLDGRYMSFRNRQLAEILSNYFESVWRGALVLKDTREIKSELLESIAQRLD
jgi:hypothetical protein